MTLFRIQQAPASTGASMYLIPSLAVPILETGMALGDLNLASMDFCIPKVDSSKGVTGPLTCIVLCMYFLGGKDP